MFKFVGMPCLHSLSNDAHVNEKTLETVGKSYTLLSAISKMSESQFFD